MHSKEETRLALRVKGKEEIEWVAEILDSLLPGLGGRICTFGKFVLGKEE